MTSTSNEQETKGSAQEFLERINAQVGLADALASGIRGADYDLPTDVAAAWKDLELVYKRLEELAQIFVEVAALAGLTVAGATDED